LNHTCNERPWAWLIDTTCSIFACAEAGALTL
jgi:hypothetical protein